MAFSLLIVAGGCGGGSSGGGGDPGGGNGPGASSDLHAPLFSGVRSIATAGGASVRIDWAPAEDDGSAASAVTYRVYASAAAGGQDFSTPVLTTAPGATSAILSNTTTPLVAVAQSVHLVVRAQDEAGNEDENTVELRVIPVASSGVAFVSDTAGGPGTIGDPTDPFPTIQAGVTAVEVAGGGAVLVDADAGGTAYVPAASVSLSAAVSSIGLFGGFARFSALGAGPSGEEILGSRDVAGRATTIAGTGVFPAQLVNVANTPSLTYVDGFTFDDTRPVTGALTGTLTFEAGRTKVTGVGTLFGAELAGGDVIRLDAHGICVGVSFVNTNNELFLNQAYPGPNGSGAGSELGASVRALTATDARLQFSCNRLLCGSNLFSDTTAITEVSSISIVGNQALHTGPQAFEVGGGVSHLRFDGNHVERRGQPIEDNNSASGLTNVLASGCSMHISHNLLEDNQGTSSGPMVDLAFAPAVPGSGGTLRILVEHNECRNHFNNSIDLDYIADVGDGGSVNFTARHNLSNGASSDGIEMTTMAGDPFPGVDITINLHDNTITNCDSIPIDIDIGVAAGRTTRCDIDGNLMAIGESEMIELSDEEPGTPDASDGGVILMGIDRNVGLGGAEDLEVEVGVAHGGRTLLSVVENTVLSSEDMGMNLDLENHIGTTTNVYAFPDGVYCFNLFNNDVEGHDDEGVEVEDARSGTGQSLAIGYISHNYVQSGADGSDGALDFQCESDDAGWRIQRSVFGLGGSEGSEAGIEYDTNTGSIRNDVLIVNNTALLASGGGFEFDTDGSQPQCINNTAAFNGINHNDNANFENDNSNSNLGDGQVYILNCIGSHAGGENGDFDIIGGFRPLYSLARDQMYPTGLGNIGGEPFYERDVTDLPFPISNEYITTLFTLKATSPAVNAGHPAAKYEDPDGSRNDMGAYGGPGSGPLGPTTAGTPVPFAYVSMYPSVNLPSGSVLVPDNQTILLGFTKPVDAATLDAITITSDGAPVPGTKSLVAGGHLVEFVPSTVLTPGASDFVGITIGAGLQATTGQAVELTSSFRFAVQPTNVIAEAANDDGNPGLTPADLASAQDLGIGPAPAVFDVTATISAIDDDDVYSFTASAGDRLMATLLDARLGGGNNGSVFMDLYDAGFNRITEGRRQIFNDIGAVSGDAYLDHTFAAAGTYYIVIYNRLVSGSSHTLRAILDN